MEEIMQSNAFFVMPLAVSYSIVCGAWFLMNSKTNWWSPEAIRASESPAKDLLLGFASVIVIVCIGQLYSAGFLLPDTKHEIANKAIWILNNFFIFSPIFLTLWLRKQSLATVLISFRNAHIKLAFGLAASVIGVALFLTLRGGQDRISSIFSTALTLESISYFPAVFFENVALAFLFVRLKWFAGIKWAIVIPSVLFALAHVPGSIAEGDPWSHIITFFFLTGSLTTIILYTAYRSRDILWLGIVHYMMDIAIKAF